jgi:hypothetical protein
MKKFLFLILFAYSSAFASAELWPWDCMGSAIDLIETTTPPKPNDPNCLNRIMDALKRCLTLCDVNCHGFPYEPWKGPCMDRCEKAFNPVAGCKRKTGATEDSDAIEE